MGFRVALIGGYGCTGRSMAKMFRDEGYSVVVTGPNEAKGLAAAKELGVEYLKDNVAAAMGADMVVLLVSYNILEEVIREVASHLKPAAIFVNSSPVKDWPSEMMAHLTKTGVEVVGAYPVFGTALTEEEIAFQLQTIRGTRGIVLLRRVMERHGFRIIG